MVWLGVRLSASRQALRELLIYYIGIIMHSAGIKGAKFKIKLKRHSTFLVIDKNDWKYIKNLKLDKYIGRIINDVEITASGLLAGAHLKGVGGLKTYLESDGKNDVKDRKGTPISRYISQFANYDVSDITN